MSRIICSDAIEGLKSLSSESVQMCVTSPPYYGLRDYGIDGQIGIEHTPQEYIARLMDVFAEVYRILKKDGTLWLNISERKRPYVATNRGERKEQESIRYKQPYIRSAEKMGKYQAERYDRYSVDARVCIARFRLLSSFGYYLAKIK